MKVIHAGSVSCEKLRGFFCNSYNVVTTKKNKIEEELKILNGEFIGLRHLEDERGSAGF